MTILNTLCLGPSLCLGPLKIVHSTMVTKNCTTCINQEPGKCTLPLLFGVTLQVEKDDDLGDNRLSKAVMDTKNSTVTTLGLCCQNSLPMQNLHTKYIDISILHVHTRCFEKEIENSLKSCIKSQTISL